MLNIRDGLGTFTAPHLLTALNISLWHLHPT